MVWREHHWQHPGQHDPDLSQCCGEAGIVGTSPFCRKAEVGWLPLLPCRVDDECTLPGAYTLAWHGYRQGLRQLELYQPFLGGNPKVACSRTSSSRSSRISLRNFLSCPLLATWGNQWGGDSKPFNYQEMAEAVAWPRQTMGSARTEPQGAEATETRVTVRYADSGCVDLDSRCRR